jgi:hypothetical protein
MDGSATKRCPLLGFKAIIFEFLGYLKLLKKNGIIKFAAISESLAHKKSAQIERFLLMYLIM